MDCPCLLFDHRNDWFLCGYHIQRSYRTGKLHTGSSNLCNRSFAWKIYFSFFSRKILFYSASITVIFQIIITALELVMPDLLGALGISSIFVSYRLVQNHNTSACQNRFWWSFILFFSITMPISVYFFWKTNFRLNCKTA